MSKPNDPEFDKLHRLLALKRYERPPQGYFDNFLAEFHRRQRAEPIRNLGWWEQLAEFFRGEPLLAARYALGGAFVLLLCVNAFLLMQRPAAVETSQVATVREEQSFGPMPAPEVFAQQRPILVASNTGPQYILDRVKVAPASYDADF